MNDHFGMKRVVEPAWSAPVSAWKLDNNRQVNNDELRIRIRQIQVEGASFQQICQECGGDESKIKEKFIDIIQKRGKLHNPSTNSGGILYGTIEEVGSEYGQRAYYKLGDEVICLTSLTALPIHLDRIDRIDYHYCQLEVDGYAIVFSTSPLIHRPQDLGIQYILPSLDEAGSLLRIHELAKEKSRFLILGSDFLSVLLYGSAIRKAAGESVRIVAALDLRSVAMLPQEEVREVLGNCVNQIYLLDILSPMKSFREISRHEGELFDLSVNCADLYGAEAVSVLLTKPFGTVSFSSLVNNYNVAVLFAESLGKEIQLSALDAYSQGCAVFNVDLLRQIKPSLERLQAIYEKTPAKKRLPAESEGFFKYKASERMGDFIYRSDKTERIVEDALNIAGYDCNVVIQGETGVGKERLLTLIHSNSNRSLHPCIKINCASISENLAESEFFGYEAGAFTGASTSGKAGYFELANNGILFLDEVGMLPLPMQAKLLRVLQENQFYRIGGQTQVDVNVRVICASNIDLKEQVKEGNFREDLYYRLNVCNIRIPPLRERSEDILCLAQFFLNNYNQRYGMSKQMDESACRSLLEYRWPGNVRELENTIHRVVVSARGNEIRDLDIARIIHPEFYLPEPGIMAKGEDGEGAPLGKAVELVERMMIEEALRKYKNTRKAAEKLGISQSQFMRKKAKYHISS